MVKVGIFGGSGLDDPQIIQDAVEKDTTTPFGKPSSPLTIGKIEDVDVVIIARHGKGHVIQPSKINFRANLLALKEEGCTHILAATAVGSLREDIKPENLAFPDQFIDFTKLRSRTVFENKIAHTPMAEPFNKRLRNLLCMICDELNFSYNKDVTIITIEGPCFSTRAESHLFKKWGADIINMSTCPEVILANELSIPYQSIAMVTDYDCWKVGEEPVTWELILERMDKNSDKVKKVLVEAIKRLGNAD